MYHRMERKIEAGSRVALILQYERARIDRNGRDKERKGTMVEVGFVARCLVAKRETKHRKVTVRSASDGKADDE